jgi:hypothetical protein
MTVDSFTSTSASVSAPSAVLANLLIGAKLLSKVGGFVLRLTPAGLTIGGVDATTGAQTVLTFPLSLAAARNLAIALLRITT